MEMYMKSDYLPQWFVEKHFKDKDLISVNDLIDVIDDLDYELEKLKEEHQDLIDNVRDNYKFIGTREAIGYDETTW